MSMSASERADLNALIDANVRQGVVIDELSKRIETIEKKHGNLESYVESVKKLYEEMRTKVYGKKS